MTLSNGPSAMYHGSWSVIFDVIEPPAHSCGWSAVIISQSGIETVYSLVAESYDTETIDPTDESLNVTSP